MKKVLFFLLFLLVAIITPLFSQPIFIVKSVDSQYSAEGDFCFEGELRESSGCGICFAPEVEVDHNLLHIFYKSKIISISPNCDIKLNSFFYGEKNSSDDLWYPFNNDYSMEQPPLTFDNIEEGTVQSTDWKTGRIKTGVIKDGDITIEYRHRSKTIALYFSKLKIDWK